MDPLLRAEITRYGEMAQATYDSFIFDPALRYYANCKFPPHEFFEGLEMEEEHGYNVTRYLFVQAGVKLPKFFMKSRWPKEWSVRAAWIGYVAVSSDETSRRLGRRDIAIVWRGTQTKVEWIEDLRNFLVPVSSEKIPSPDENVKVEAGFLDLYTHKDENCQFCKYSGREMILAEVKRLAEMYPNDELSITTTGHSLGAALAVLSAYDIPETGLNLTHDNRSIPISSITFAGPRVGNVNFMKRVEALGVKVLRVVNVHDIVPKAPGLVFSDLPRWFQELTLSFPRSFVHVGVELILDHKKSPYLKDNDDVGNAHNLEGILHVLDGYHGKGRGFELATDRDIALVNKSCDFLKDDCRIPPSWMQDHNKGMVRNEQGRWVQPERPSLPPHQIHPHDIDHHLKHFGLT